MFHIQLLKVCTSKTPKVERNHQASASQNGLDPHLEYCLEPTNTDTISAIQPSDIISITMGLAGLLSAILGNVLAYYGLRALTTDGIKTVLHVLTEIQFLTKLTPCRSLSSSASLSMPILYCEDFRTPFSNCRAPT